jgi:hypothetical protein
MDDFLTKMYEDEMEKTSAAELDNFMGSLSVEELEGLLGLDSVDFTKVAVAGPVEPPMPDSLPGNELDAQMKTVEEIAAKSRTDTPPTRQQEAEPTAVSHQGPGKVPTTKEAIAWADHIGRIFAKQAAATPDWYDRQVQATQAAQESIQSMKTAAVKAKIAQRALRATSGAPPHVKQAAAKVAALQITAACKKMSQYGEEEGMEKEDEFTTPMAKAKAKAMAGAMKAGKGAPGRSRKKLVSAMGKTI